MVKRVPIILLTALITAFIYSGQRYEFQNYFYIGHTDHVSSIDISSDGRYALTLGDGCPKLWDIANGKVVRSYTGYLNAICSAAFSPDNKSAISGAVDRTDAFFLPGGKQAVSYSYDGEIKLWDLQSGRNIRTFFDGKLDISKLLVSPDGKYLFACGKVIKKRDGLIDLWDLADGRLLADIPTGVNSLNAAAFSPDGKTVLTGDDSGNVRSWDVPGLREENKVRAEFGSVYGLQYSTDGKELLVKCENSITLLDPDGEKEIIKIFANYENELFNLTVDPENNFYNYRNIDAGRITPDGKALLLGANGSLDLWDIASGKRIRPFSRGVFAQHAAVFSPDGRYALFGGGDFSIRLLDISSGDVIRRFKGHSGRINHVFFTPDGKSAVSDAGDDLIKIWDLSTGREKLSFRRMPEIKLEEGRSMMFVAPKPCSLALSPDGRFILSSDSWPYQNKAETIIRLYETATGREIRDYHFPYRTDLQTGVESLDFSPDGGTFAACQYNQIKVWNVLSGAELKTIDGKYERNYFASARFSPDGKRVLTGFGHSTDLRTWDLESGKELKRMSLHAPEITSIAFSRDGKLGLTASYSEEILNTLEIFAWTNVYNYDGEPLLVLWDMKARKQVSWLKGHEGSVCSAAFSPDGRLVISASDDCTVKVWDTANRECDYTVFATADGEYVTWTPEGFYTGSDGFVNGLCHVAYDGVSLDYSRFRKIYYRPDLVSAKVRGEVISTNAADVNIVSMTEGPGAVFPPEIAFINKTRFIPGNVLEAIDGKDYNKGNEVDTTIPVKVRVTDTGSGIGDIVLRINGKKTVISGDKRKLKPVTSAPGNMEYIFEYDLTYTVGPSIEISVYDAGNKRPSRPITAQIWG